MGISLCRPSLRNSSEPKNSIFCSFDMIAMHQVSHFFSPVPRPYIHQHTPSSRSEIHFSTLCRLFSVPTPPPLEDSPPGQLQYFVFEVQLLNFCGLPASQIWIPRYSLPGFQDAFSRELHSSISAVLEIYFPALVPPTSLRPGHQSIVSSARFDPRGSPRIASECT